MSIPCTECSSPMGCRDRNYCNAQEARHNKAHTHEPAQVGVIDMTPTWGEWGNMAKAVARSSSPGAILELWPDIARAMAAAEAIKALKAKGLSLEQLEIVQDVMSLELFKQGVK